MYWLLYFSTFNSVSRSYADDTVNVTWSAFHMSACQSQAWDALLNLKIKADGVNSLWDVQLSFGRAPLPTPLLLLCSDIYSFGKLTAPLCLQKL